MTDDDQNTVRHGDGGFGDATTAINAAELGSDASVTGADPGPRHLLTGAFSPAIDGLAAETLPSIGGLGTRRDLNRIGARASS
jgi:hypothetical protein